MAEGLRWEYDLIYYSKLIDISSEFIPSFASEFFFIWLSLSTSQVLYLQCNAFEHDDDLCEWQASSRHNKMFI